MIVMMEAYTRELGWLLASLFIGVSLGSLTGLIPGFHVNNVALILLALSPALLEIGILSGAAAIIVATGTVYTFLNYIPSALIECPTEILLFHYFRDIVCCLQETLQEV